MTQLIAIITLINQLFPFILQTIESVELAFPNSGQGALKLEIVKNVVQKAMESAGGLAVTVNQVMPMLGSIVAGMVALKNATGLFKTSSKA